MDYNYKEIEKKWQQYWRENHTYKCEIDNSRPKFYVLQVCTWDIRWVTLPATSMRVTSA